MLLLAPHHGGETAGINAERRNNVAVTVCISKPVIQLTQNKKTNTAFNMVHGLCRPKQRFR